MSLTDDQITLVPITPATRAALAEASRAAAESVGARMTPALVPTSDAAIDAFVAQWAAERARGTGAGYLIMPAAGGAALGVGFLNSVHPVHRFANVGYWVRPEAAGQGAATAAVALLARDGFERLKLVRLELVIEPSNAASRRVAEKAGAVFEGVLKNRLVSRGAVRDAAMYALLPNGRQD